MSIATDKATGRAVRTVAGVAMLSAFCLAGLEVVEHFSQVSAFMQNTPLIAYAAVPGVVGTVKNVGEGAVNMVRGYPFNGYDYRNTTQAKILRSWKTSGTIAAVALAAGYTASLLGQGEAWHALTTPVGQTLAELKL